jgi:voltage-gated potassium channel Kch
MPLRFSTAMNSFDAYGHTVTLETLGYSFDVTVYFAAEESFTRNVLGRRGWLDQVRLGLVEYESKLYLSRYNER